MGLCVDVQLIVCIELFVLFFYFFIFFSLGKNQESVYYVLRVFYTYPCVLHLLDIFSLGLF